MTERRINPSWAVKPTVADIAGSRPAIPELTNSIKKRLRDTKTKLLLFHAERLNTELVPKGSRLSVPKTRFSKGRKQRNPTLVQEAMTMATILMDQTQPRCSNVE